jgi:hypothetical protein
VLALSTLVGLALNVVILRDMFQTLFTPSGSGAVSTRVVRFAWGAARRVSRSQPDRLGLVGPLALVLIILLWTGGLILGWAFLLWPHLPDQFLLAAGLAPDQTGNLLDALYLSTVTLSTLGYGDITPQAPWLRLVAPLEAVIGFALLTASVSWIMSIYPNLSRLRTLAREVALLGRPAQEGGTPLFSLDPSPVTALLQELTTHVVTARNDLVQFPIVYYFRPRDPASALDVALPQLVTLARTARHHPDPSVRWHGMLLLAALEDLTQHLGAWHLDCETEATMDEVLTAYAADHLRPAHRR